MTSESKGLASPVQLKYSSCFTLHWYCSNQNLSLWDGTCDRLKIRAQRPQERFWRENVILFLTLRVCKLLIFFWYRTGCRVFSLKAIIACSPWVLGQQKGQVWVYLTFWSTKKLSLV